jgi:subtilisin-like proprotein convertase family protein
MVNSDIQVFDRFTGAAQTAQININTLFASLSGSLCATSNQGDPVVLYDPLADRWLISQFAFNTQVIGGQVTPVPPFFMSVGISKTADPTGAYYVYCFPMPNSKLNDYPKFGVWPDAYYMSDNQFIGNALDWAGAGVFAFDRAKMLVGDPNASYIYFDLELVDLDIGGLLPADLDGPPPPVGTPNYFSYFTANEFAEPGDALRLFEFHADFANTNLASFIERGESPLNVAAFIPYTNNIPQSGTAQQVNSLGDRLMFRLQYRNFTSNESLVVTHSVVGGSSQAAVRYYQLRRNLPSGNFAVKDQATFAPDATHRWMGSAAMDYQGNLAVGYSASSSSIFPAIRYAGRLASDPTNGLFQGEATMQAGGGAQTGSDRWGDYSALTVDPTDDATFWYTTEYYTSSSSVNWNTRIGKFQIATNSPPAPQGTIQGLVSNANTASAISNATVRTTSGYSRQTGASGGYSMRVPTGSYDMIASASGYASATNNGVSVSNGGTTTQNFPMVPLRILVADGATITAESCGPANNHIDPDEIVTVNLALKNIGASNAVNLVATLLATGGVTSPSGPQTYGLVTAGGATVAQSFTFTATGTCGGNLVAVLQLQDGATNLGTITNTFTLGVPVSTTVSNSNTTAIAIPASGTSGSASPYPSTITMSGVSGTVAKVTVTLTGLSHSFPDDIDILLVGPTGAKTLLMSDTGGGTDVNNITLTFDDDAVSSLMDTNAITAGTYQPTDFDTASDTFASPAPSGPYTAGLSVFNATNPNGTWSLYVRDDATQDSGSIAQGWKLTVTTAGGAVCCSGPANFPPAVTGASILGAFSDEPLSVVNIATNDFEDEAITIAYQWQFSTNGTAYVDSSTGSTLPVSPANSGKLWRCRITPSDPSGTGTNFFTATVAVNNRPNMLGRHGQFYSYDSDLFLAGGTGTTFTRNALINEFSQGTSGGEWVEILFLKNSNACGWKLFDSNSGTVTFSNSGLWSNVAAGTLLVIYNGANRDTVLPVDDTNASDETLIIAHGNTTFFSGSWIALGNGGDSISLTESNSTLIDGVSYGSNSSQTPQLGSVGSGLSAGYTNNTEAGVDSAANWQTSSASSATPSVGNGIVNSNFVAQLRGGGPPLFRFGTTGDTVPGISIDGTNGLTSGILNAPTGGFYNVVIERYAGTNIVSQQYNLLVGDSNNIYTIPAGKTWAMNNNYTIPGTLVVQGLLDTAGHTLTVSNLIDITAGTVSNATGLIVYHKLAGGPLPGSSQQFNSLPVISAASITPAAPVDTDDLLATVTGASDADSDPISFAYQWQDSGNDTNFNNIAFTSASLTNTATTPGNYYRCVITPNDGIADGAAFTTTSVRVALPLEILSIQLSGPDIVITYNAVGGTTNELQSLTDLTLSNWVGIATNFDVSTGPAQFIDAGAAAQTNRFYRIRLLP